MNLDRQIDPVTLDYVNSTTKPGAFEEVDVLENQIVISFFVALTEWEGDPDTGNRFGELARATDTAENRKRLEDLAKDALRWLVDDGSLETVNVLVEQFRPGGVAFQVDAYKPGKRVREPLPTLFVPVGAA